MRKNFEPKIIIEWLAPPPLFYNLEVLNEYVGGEIWNQK